ATFIIAHGIGSGGIGITDTPGSSINRETCHGIEYTVAFIMHTTTIRIKNTEINRVFKLLFNSEKEYLTEVIVTPFGIGIFTECDQKRNVFVCCGNRLSTH